MAPHQNLMAMLVASAKGRRRMGSAGWESGPPCISLSLSLLLILLGDPSLSRNAILISGHRVATGDVCIFSPMCCGRFVRKVLLKLVRESCSHRLSFLSNFWSVVSSHSTRSVRWSRWHLEQITKRIHAARAACGGLETGAGGDR
jgi:hypothetical protein